MKLYYSDQIHLVLFYTSFADLTVERRHFYSFVALFWWTFRNCVFNRQIKRNGGREKKNNRATRQPTKKLAEAQRSIDRLLWLSIRQFRNVDWVEYFRLLWQISASAFFHIVCIEPKRARVEDRDRAHSNRETVGQGEEATIVTTNVWYFSMPLPLQSSLTERVINTRIANLTHFLLYSYSTRFDF